MNYMRLNEKMLKHNLKKKCRITLSLIVSFLITGSIGFLEEESYAQDLRPRTKRDNDIKIDSSGGIGPDMTKSANNMDVVNIVEPNSGGISHNQFIEFSIGAENGAIFNNNATEIPVVTKTGGIVSQNPKITKSATAILSEITGTKISNIDGSIEVAGQKADFILANENGIAVNGGTFINTSGVTLTTGKPTVNNDTINLNVQKGNISVEEFGLGTSGDLFNIVSKTIELKGQVGVISGETDADITLIAGQNKVDIKKGNVAELKEVTGHAKDENQKYGIYASSLGAMYGKNIRLISTTEGLGVKHEGLVRGIGDININSAGDISVGALISENKIDIKGKKDFETTLGNFKNSTYYQNYSVSSNNGIKIDVDGDIIIQSMVDTGVEGLSIVGKNLTMKANSTAKILSQTELKIKLDGLLKIEATMIPKQPGRPYQKPPLVIEKDKNGQIVVKVPETGEILKPDEYYFINTGVIGDKIDVDALEIINEAIITNGTSRKESYITLKALNSFLNEKLILSSGNLAISSEKKFQNKGVVKSTEKIDINTNFKNIINEGIIEGGKNVTLDTKEGDITNSGELSSGKDLDIKGNNITNNGTRDIIVGKNLKLDGNNVLNSKKISAGGSVDIKAKGSVENNELIAKENIDIKSGSSIKSKILQTNKSVNMDGSSITIEKKLDAGENFTSKVKDTNVEFESGSTVNVKKDLLVDGGGLINKGDLTVGGKITIRKESSTNSGFENIGNLNAGDNVSIDVSKTVKNSGDFNTGKKLDIKTTGDIKNNEKLQSSGNLKIKGGKFNNPGNILGQNVDIESSGDLSNNGKIEAKQGIKIKGTNSKLTNLKEIKSEGDIDIQVTKDIENKGSIASDKNLSLESKKMLNEQSGKIQGKNDVSIKIHDGFKNEGLLQSNGALTIDLGSNNVDVFLNSNNIKSLGLMKLITGGQIENSGRFQNFGALDFKSLGNIKNSGMLVSSGGIKLDSVNFDNKSNSTVWSGKDIDITATNKISNNGKSTIEAKGDMNLKAKELQNLAGTISSGKNMDLKIDKIINKSTVSGGVWIDGFWTLAPNPLIFEGRDRYSNAYVNYEFAKVTMPQIRNSLNSTERASISAGENLDIRGINANTNILNDSGTIMAGKNFQIKGDIINQTLTGEVSVKELLKNTYVELRWEQKLLGTEAHWNSGEGYRGSLWDALVTGQFNTYYYKALKLSATGTLDKALSALLGALWKHDGPRDESKWDSDAKFTYYGANSNAKIIAGGNFSHSSGYFRNLGGEIGGYKSVNVQIGDKSVAGSQASLGVSVSNPNTITEVEGVKQVHKMDIQTGSVTLNGIVITNDGLITDIAIAGTINPVVYIEIPTGENGIFKAARPNPEGRTPFKYETNLDFIDLSKYYGSDYFFKQVGYAPEKTSTVIGDAYYEHQLVNRTIKEALLYSGEINTNQIKLMLDGAANIKDTLKLEIGKPLTAAQVNTLEKDIIWYIEMEVEDEITLVPQIYFGKDNRIKMAKSDTGGGYSSEVKVGGDIDINAEDFVNTKGNITAGNNIAIKSKNNIINNSSEGVVGKILGRGNIILDADKNIDIVGGAVTSSDGNALLTAKGDIKLDSTLIVDENGNQKISDKGKIEAKGNISIVAKKSATIKGGSIESTGEKNITIKGEDVQILSQNLIGSDITQENDKGVVTTATLGYSESVGSLIAGNNIGITSGNSVGIQGSNVVAKNDVSIDAKGDVNITDNQSFVSEKVDSSGVGFDDEGLLFIKSESSERNLSKSVGSTVGGVKGVKISSDGDTVIKGSNLLSGDGGTSITSKGDVNIIDGQDTDDMKFDSMSYKVVAFTKEEIDRKTTKSKGSTLSTKGSININAKNDVKVVGSNLAALKDTNISAEKDVRFEAGKNTLEEKSNSLTVGITTVDAGVGIAGMSATGGWTPTGGGVGKLTDGGIGKQGDGKNPENANIMKGGSLGKNYMDSLISAKTQVGVDIQKSSEKSETWTESNLNTGGNLTIKSGGTADIGGADFNSGGDISIEGKSIETTKYEDKTEKETSGITVGIQLSNNTTSAIADAVNKGAQIADTILDPDKELNEALTSAQIAGSVSNVIFGDLIGNTSAITGELALNNSSSKTTKENITDIKAKGNINIKSNDGDINLAGVDIKGEEIALDSSRDINIRDAKETRKDSSDNLSVSAGVTSSSGVSALDGGFTQVGVAANVQAGNSNKDNTISHRSIIEGTNVIVKSGRDTNIKGSNVEGDTVDLDIGGNLNIESVADKYDENRVEGWGGVDVSGGLATNTIGTGDVGLSAGGGNIYKKGEEIKNQAGIIAKNKLTGKVKGDANLVGSVAGSKTGEGNLDIGGNLNVKDLTTQLSAGGEILGGNIGTKGGGIRGEVGDLIDKNVTAKGGIGLNSNNVSIGGDVTLGKSGEKNEAAILGKIENGIIVNKDATKAGGTFSGTGSIINGKKKKDKKTNNAEPKIETKLQKITGKTVKDSIEPDNFIKKKITIPEKSIEINGIEIDNKSLTEALKIASEKIKILNENQLKLKDKNTTSPQGKFKLDLEFRLLKESIKDYVTNKNLETSEEIFNSKAEIKSLLNSINDYEANDNLYFSGKKEEKDELTKELTIITRSEKDVLKNLKTVAESVKNIPEEHLLGYLNNLIKNSDFENSQNNLTGEKKEVLIKNPSIDHTEESELSLSKIYNKIYLKTDSNLRDELTLNFEKRFSDDKEVIKFLKEGDLTLSSTKKIAEKIQNLKAESYEDVLGEEYTKVKINVLPPKNDGVLGGNNGQILNIYLQNDSARTVLLETIVHELTHQDQNNLKKLNIEGFNDITLLYGLNSSKGGYIKIDNGRLYREQPIENEAYKSESIVKKLASEINSKEEAISKLTKELQEITDKIDGENTMWKDTSKEEKIIKVEAPPLLYGNPEKEKYNEIQHLPKKKTGNLEDPLLEPASKFGDSVLIYGASPDDNGNMNRDGLVLEANTNKTQPLVADSFLDNFNSHHISESNEMEYMTPDLKKLVKLIKEDKVISEEVLNDISKYKESVDEMFLTNKVSPELNKEILKDFIQDSEVKDIFIKIDKLNKELELTDNKYEDKQEKLTEQIENEYRKFFSKKTIYIADRILTNGGKIYFALNGVATTVSNSKLSFDKKKLEKILFDKKSKHYDKLTSQELRFLYNKHIENPNLKFLINKQVVDKLPIFLFDKSKNKETILQENKKKIKEKNKVKEYKESLNQDSNDRTILTRSSKDIKKNLKLVAKNSKNIPTEHLNSFLGDILINSNEKRLRENNKNSDVILENPDLNHNKESAENLLSIYNQIYQGSEKSELISYNNAFFSYLQHDRKIKDLLVKDNVKKDDIQELVKIIGDLKSQAFEKEFKKDYDKVNLIVKGPDPNKSGELSGNALIIYFDSEGTKNMKEYLGTVVHEYTHNDQRNLRKYELLSPKDNLGYLYALNSSKNGYLNPTSSNKGYKEQPVEMEAFSAQNNVLTTTFELGSPEIRKASVDEKNLLISNLKEMEEDLSSF